MRTSGSPLADIARDLRAELRTRIGERADIVRFDDADIWVEDAAQPSDWHVRAVAFPIGLTPHWRDALAAVRLRHPYARKHRHR